MTAHFLGPVAPRPVAAIDVGQDRPGATGSSRAELRQEGHLRAVAQVLTLAGAGDGGEPAVATRAPAPARDFAPEDGEPFELPTTFVPFAQHLEFHVLQGTHPLGRGVEPRLLICLVRQTRRVRAGRR